MILGEFYDHVINEDFQVSPYLVRKDCVYELLVTWIFYSKGIMP